MTATQLLKKDHATVKQLFARFEKQGERAQETKQSIFSEIQRELETHSTIEEEIFYPAVRESVGGTDELVDESLEEHNVLKSLLSELSSLSADDEEFDAKMTVLQENVEHHVEEEEGEMFPKVEAQLGQERLQELGSQLQARKEVLGQPTIKRIMSGVSGLIFGNGESTAETEGAARGGRRRSARKSSAKQRGANKKATGGARAAQKPSSASAKKRSSGRSAEMKAAPRRSHGQKRTAAGGGNRRRGSGRSSKRR
jgi:hemerythrin-like domain-containing protein